MTTIKLVDSTFTYRTDAVAIGLSGENTGEHPESFRWDAEPGDAPVKVWTDIRLAEAVGDPAERRVGILVESPVVAKESHKTALQLRDEFDAIFTHDRALLETGPPFLFYPLGGSWIRRWGMFPKRKLYSVIVGAKTNSEGQRLRHAVAERYEIDAWGEPYTERLPSKRPMLRPYYYSVVIENGRKDWYFSEKLIDCLSQGTIPIYWGCPDVGRFFYNDGIIPFRTLKELDGIMKRISIRDYYNRAASVAANLVAALSFRCAEDWIWDRHKGVFECVS